MYTSFTNMTLDRALVVRDAGTGMPVIAWVEPVRLIGPKETPSYSCTVIGFDDVAERDAYMARAVEGRANATVRTASSPSRGGPYVVLEVHLDRPTTPGTGYDEVVGYLYDGRGPVCGTIEGGKSSWTEVRSERSLELYRSHPEGTEVAMPVGLLGTSLDPDLARELSALMDRHGVRSLGDGYVGKVYPDGDGSALYKAGVERRDIQARVDRLVFVGTAREEARALMSNPSAQRMLRRMDEGCLVMWAGNNSSTWKQFSSYQVWPGKFEPWKVSGDHAEVFVRLGAAERLCESTPAYRFHGCLWTLLRITDEGRALLRGDLPTAVSKARCRSITYELSRKRNGGSLVEVVTAYAAGIPPETKVAMLKDLFLPRSMRLQVHPRAGISPEVMNTVLLAVMSGQGEVTEDGILRPVKPAKAKQRA